ncbi:endonuclease/exonuclease/phosphatase family protein [Geopsychrobacter electrodiphilus]|uniref:endonuclease/exonuclease/phosphatase family protein n=1 Tax=Geopsychrobacter electrodiphilus TaxID=225196 RepID=UPI00036162F4|nr:endonuclease/exonuclease/phosphatase family protein [Geopsychrobacter electrodiphilus]
MSILRVMTYALKGTTARDVAVLAQMLRAQRPELVYLQYLTADLLLVLARETGLQAYGDGENCGFLSRHPLTALQTLNLGGNGCCSRADLTLVDKRIHLFNIQLNTDPALRRQQIVRLFSDDLLGARLPCALLIAGDFSLPIWGGGQWLLRQRLKPVPYPTWGANYPATFPLWPRDRFYLRGPIRALAGQVVSAQEIRSISNHLPVIATLELTDTRVYLKVPEVAEPRMRPATS